LFFFCFREKAAYEFLPRFVGWGMCIRDSA